MNVIEMSPLNKGKQVALYQSQNTDAQKTKSKQVYTWGPFLVTKGCTLAAKALGVILFFSSAAGVSTGLQTLVKVPSDKAFFRDWHAPVVLTAFAITFITLLGVCALAVSSFCSKRQLDRAKLYTRLDV